MSELQQQYNQGNTKQVPFGVVQHNLSNIMPSDSEIGNLWSSYQAETMPVCFLKYYVAKSKDPDIQAKQIADKQLSGLASFLDDEDLPLTIAFGNAVSNSTESPQSDKMIMSHVTVAISFIIAQYGLALSSTSRKDLVAVFTKYVIELQSFAKDGAVLMIECGWLERIPETPDRKKLLS